MDFDKEFTSWTSVHPSLYCKNIRGKYFIYLWIGNSANSLPKTKNLMVPPSKYTHFEITFFYLNPKVATLRDINMTENYISSDVLKELGIDFSMFGLNVRGSHASFVPKALVEDAIEKLNNSIEKDDGVGFICKHCGCFYDSASHQTILTCYNCITQDDNP